MAGYDELEVDIETVVDLSDIIASLRELSDEEIEQHGFSVEGTWDEVDDPVLLGPDGRPFDTWREGYPYQHRMQVSGVACATSSMSMPPSDEQISATFCDARSVTIET